jgi:hypothetical protein
VETGAFAAVVPAHAIDARNELACEVVDEIGLEELDRPVSLAWTSRAINVMGEHGERVRDELVETLRAEAELRGMTRYAREADVANANETR